MFALFEDVLLPMVTFGIAAVRKCFCAARMRARNHWWSGWSNRVCRTNVTLQMAGIWVAAVTIGSGRTNVFFRAGVRIFVTVERISPLKSKTTAGKCAVIRFSIWNLSVYKFSFRVAGGWRIRCCRRREQMSSIWAAMPRIRGCVELNRKQLPISRGQHFLCDYYKIKCIIYNVIFKRQQKKKSHVRRGLFDIDNESESSQILFVGLSYWPVITSDAKAGNLNHFSTAADITKRQHWSL